MTYPIACPLDALPLHQDGSVFHCSNGHSYDKSRIGYLNLLPVQFKPSGDPGDSKSMVNARQHVMASGVFDEIAAKICDLVITIRNRQERPFHVVDAGCGEGFFTNKIIQALNTGDNQQSESCQILGVDISKAAIVAACKAYRTLNWAVANNKRLPIVPGSTDLITSLFGFECWQHWAEVQTKAQSVLVVRAGPNHLIELRRLIYDTVEVTSPASSPVALESGYQLQQEHHLSLLQKVPSEVLSSVLEMTPHIHRINKAKLDAVDFSNAMMVTFEVTIFEYSRV